MAGSYFHCNTIVSRQVELDDIRDQSVPDPAYEAIEGAVTSDAWNPEEAIQILRSNGIRYIIQSHDMIEKDGWTYGFLSADGLMKTSLGDLTIYQIME